MRVTEVEYALMRRKAEEGGFESVSEFILDCVKNGKQPINNIDSALESTLQALMGTKAIYEKRIVTWEEVSAA